MAKCKEHNGPFINTNEVNSLFYTERTVLIKWRQFGKQLATKRYLIQLIQEKGIIFTINEVAADEMSKNLFKLLTHDMEACEWEITCQFIEDENIDIFIYCICWWKAKKVCAPKPRQWTDLLVSFLTKLTKINAGLIILKARTGSSGFCQKWIIFRW